MPEKFQNIYIEVVKVGRGIAKLRFFQFKHVRRFFEIFRMSEKIILSVFILALIADLSVIGYRSYIRNTVEAPTFGSSYTEGLIGEPRYLNPILAQSQTDKDITKLIFAGLYKFDGNGKMAPDLAASEVQISKNKKEYSITLKPNLKWHDHQPITADDVVFTIQTIQNPDYKSPLRKIWQNIIVQKADELTVKFTSKNISAPFISNLNLGILPKHVWSNINPDNFLLTKYNLEAVGSGPYFIKQINKSPSASGKITSVTLESYADYWKSRPQIQKLYLKFFKDYQEALFAMQSKEINGFGFIPFDRKIYVDPKTKLRILKIPVHEYQALFINVSKSPKVLGDANVRTALARSLDRPAFINNVYFGLALPAYGPIMPNQLGYNPAIEKANSFDINEANRILDKAGWVMDKGTSIRAKSGQQLSFTITTNDYVLNAKSAEELKNQWQKIGAKIAVNTMPTIDLEKNNIRPRNYEALLFAESTGQDPDPFVFWHSSQAQNPGFNLSQYKNQNVDRLISDARTTFEENVRTEKYRQFQQIVSAEIPAIFLDQSVFVYEVSPQLKGVNISNLANTEDRFYDIINWYTQTKRIWKK